MRVVSSWFAAAITELKLYCCVGESVFGTLVNYNDLYRDVRVGEQGEMPNKAGHLSAVTLFND